MKCRPLTSFSEISQAQWEKIQPTSFPFFDYHNLLAYESSHCIGTSSGWKPAHLSLWDDKGELAGFSPVYRKNNSYGEYIFDWNWAETYQRLGLPYYPKLLSATPFTPATGPKLLANTLEGKVQLIKEAEKELELSNDSSFHFLFIEEKEADLFKEAGWIVRKTHQFHWRNSEYQSFDDFLSCLKKKRRKEILRERKKVTDQGIKTLTKFGDEIDEQDIAMMFDLYQNTVEQKWGQAYLNKAYFEALYQKMRERLVISQATLGSQVIGQAMAFFSDEALFGRNWGSYGHFDCLHFELCYYRLIEFAIERKIKLFEAGAQGPHKFQRGFLPCFTYSAHKIKHPALSDAIFLAVEKENQALEAGLAHALTESPFKQ